MQSSVFVTSLLIIVLLSSHAQLHWPIAEGSILNQVHTDVGDTFATTTYGDEVQAGQTVGGTNYTYFYWHNWIDSTGEALLSPNATLLSSYDPISFFSISPAPNSTNIIGSEYAYSWIQDSLAENGVMSARVQENATDTGTLNFRARRDVSPSNVSSPEAVVNLTVSVTPIQDVERLCVEVVLENSSQFNAILLQSQVDPQPNPVRLPLNFTTEFSANWEITNALADITYVFKLPIELQNLASPEPITYKPRVHVYTHYGWGSYTVVAGPSVSSLHPKWGTLTFSGEGEYTWNIFEKLSYICDLTMKSSWSTTTVDSHMISAKTGLGGKKIDPHSSTGGLELIWNVYETLVCFDREKTDSFVPRLATSWSVSEDRLEYTFTIRQGVKFHNGEILTTEDVEYSMERILVVDGDWQGSLFYDALLGMPGRSRDENGNIAVTSEQLDNAVTRTDTTVAFHLVRPFQPFLQVLSLPVIAVMSKDWCVSIGEWPGTWNNWTYYNKLESLINQQNTDLPGPHVNAMCGTGPYMLDYFTLGVEYSIVTFDDYWGGWPAPGLSKSISRATAKKIDDWVTRRELFLSGQVDHLAVPQASYSEVSGQPGVACIYPLPRLEVWEMMFNFNVSTSSPFLGVPGGLPPGTFGESGIPRDIFSDINARKGFAYAFNYSQLIEQAFQEDAFRPATPIIPGLPYYNPDHEKYDQNLTKARELLEAAWDGELWANGFSMKICYLWSLPWMQQACENIKANIESLNPKFHIEIHAAAGYFDYFWARELPVMWGGWLADFPDPHNFASAFMDYHYQAFATAQNYENSTIEDLVYQGIGTTDSMQRQAIYYSLQNLYWEDCPGVPIFQSRGRVFMRDWIQGWHYNPILGSVEGGMHYFYTEWKENVLPHSLSPGENIVDTVSTTGAIVSVNTTIAGNLTVTSHDISLEGVTEFGTNASSIKCVTVDTTVPHENITFPIEIKVYFTDQEVISAYVDQATLRMFYWNGTDWLLENDTGVVTPSDVQGYAGYVWAKIYHLSEFAIMGEKTLLHSVAVKAIRTVRNIIAEGLNSTIYVDVFNVGSFDETFNITLYADSNVVGTLTNLSLSSGNSATVGFTWNTLGLAKGNYFLSAYASPVPNEAAVSDNILESGHLTVTIPGDVTGDFVVDIYDAIVLANAYNSIPTSSNWNPNADINSDETVDIYDAITLANHYNQHYP